MMLNLSSQTEQQVKRDDRVESGMWPTAGGRGGRDTLKSHKAENAAVHHEENHLQKKFFSQKHEVNFLLLDQEPQIWISIWPHDFSRVSSDQRCFSTNPRGSVCSTRVQLDKLEATVQLCLL